MPSHTRTSHIPLSFQENVPSSRNCGRHNWHLIIAVTLVALFLLQGLFFILTNSQTYDEAVNLGAGYSYLATGDYRLNQEHPPLIKILCALPVYLCYQLPFEPSLKDWQSSAQWNIGRDFLYKSSVDADVMLSLARIPNLLFGAVLVYTIGLWSYQLWGKSACLFSMTLAAFDPNLITHSSLVTNDLGVAAFTYLTFYCFWSYSHRPSWKMAIAVSFSLGCALATKFSAVSLLGLLAFSTGGLLITGNGLLFPSRTQSVENQQQEITNIRHFLYFVLLGGIVVFGATVVVWASYGFGDIKVWWHGLQEVLKHQNEGHSAYLLGEYSQTGWPHYFIIAFLIKTPVASLIAMAVSIGVFWKGKTWSTRAFVTILLPVYLVFMVTLLAQINIGLRYILLVYPLLFVAAGRLATFQAKTARPILVACFMIAIGTATSTIWTAPHYLVYFNEIVGGPSKGRYYLSDSNIDWGQDLKQLAKYVERENVSMIYLSYFGTAPPDYYGIQYQNLPAGGSSIDDTTYVTPSEAKPQLLAISLFNLQRVNLGGPDIYSRLWKREPIAQIGYSIFVFDISEDTDAHVELDHVHRKPG